MDSRIDHWERQYRVRGASARHRLESLSPQLVLSAYEQALERAFGDGPEVVVVREVNVRFTANLDGLDESTFVERWARSIVVAVLRAVADGELAPSAESRDGGNACVARFPDRAIHLAAFLEAVMSDRDASRDWRFRRFAPHLRPTVPATIRETLIAEAQLVPGAFRALAARKSLGGVLSQLDVETAVQLWSKAWGGQAWGTVGSRPEALRPVFAAALAAVEQVEGTQFDRSRAEAWLVAFASEVDSPPDWRDGVSLAQGVLSAIRFLSRQGVLRSRPPAAAISQSVEDLNWLDSEWLAREWTRFHAPDLPQHQVSTTPLTRSSPTPRQRRWIDAFQAILPRFLRERDRTNPASPTNRLLAMALLSESHPDWNDDSAVAAFVERLLASAATRREQSSAGQMSRAAGETEWLGEAGQSLLKSLAEGAGVANQTSRPGGVETSAAGAFLLLRAFQDLRIGALTRHAGFPVKSPRCDRLVAGALAARWAGLESPWDDPGLRWLAGIDTEEERRESQRAWTSDPAAVASACGAFQKGLAQMLLGHRLLDDAGRLQAVRFTHPSAGPCLALGDPRNQVWPFVASLATEESMAVLLNRWAESWRELTGALPILSLSEPVEWLSDEQPIEFVEPSGTGAPLDEWTVSGAGDVGHAWANVTLDAAAQACVRAWARWFKGFEGSSTRYLLDQFIRRPGRITAVDDSLLVELQPRSLDIALEVSGYLDRLEQHHGSAVSVIEFQLGGVP